MPDNTGSFLTELTEATSLGNDDLLYAVKYENGTPVSRKVRKSTVLADTVKNVKVNGRTTVNENQESEIYISYIRNNVSGSICSFDDGEPFPFESLVTYIEPVQDLHGYDSPWVGGAGKNKLDNTASSVTYNGVTFTVNDDGSVKANGKAQGGNATIVIKTNPNLTKGTSYILNGCPQGGGSNSYRLSYSNNVDSSYADTGSGVTFTEWTGDYNDRKLYLTIADGYTVNNLTFYPMIRLASVTDASFAPYSNECPIIGWDECNVAVVGNNLVGAIIQGGWQANGQPTSALDRCRTEGYLYLKQGTYTINGWTTQQGKTIQCGYGLWESNTMDGSNVRTYDSGWKNVSQEMVLTEDTFVTISFRYTDNSNVSLSDVTFQLEIGSQSTAYEPYNGQTYIIDLGGTRYGCILDVVNGVLTVDRKYLTIDDFNSFGGSGTSAGGLHWFDAKNILKGKAGNKNICSICGYNENGWTSTITVMSVDISETQPVRIYDSSESLSDFKAKYPNLQAVYELTTPITIQLTPTQVKSLLGENRVWADTGDISLTYIRDMGDYINYLGDSLEEVESKVDRLTNDNLIGDEINFLYPVNIPGGTKITFSTSDGSIFATTSTLQVNFYDENKDIFDYFTLKNGQTSRTVTVTSGKTLRYMTWNQKPTVPIMANIGENALPYVKYLYPMTLLEKVNEHGIELSEIKDKINTINAKNNYEECYLTQSDVENGGFSTATGKHVNSKRIRSKEIIRLYEGTKLTFDINNLYWYVWEFYTESIGGGNVLSASGWQNATEYIVQNDCWVMLAFATASTEGASAAIDVSNFEDCKVKVEYNNYDSKKLYLSPWVQSAVTASGFSPSTKRLATLDAISLPYGERTIIHVELHPDYVCGIRAGRTPQNLSSNKYWYKNGNIINFTSHEQYFRFVIARYVKGSTTEYEDITEDDLVIAKPMLTFECDTIKDANLLDRNADALETFVNSQNILSASSHGSIESLPTIIHVSDAHGDYQRLKNAVNIANYCKADAMVASGDLVGNVPQSGAHWIKDLFYNLNCKAVICPGNHEVDDSSYTDEMVYNYFMGPVADKIGNTDGKTYYYTDVASKKLRIISCNLYQYGATTRSNAHMSSEQLSYICNALLTTPNNYGVIVVAHSPCVNVNNLADPNYSTFFQSLRKYGFTHYDIEGTPIYDIIDAFIARTTISRSYNQTGSPSSISVSADFSNVDSSVEFIAHMTGHIHADSICYLPTTQKQLMLNVACCTAMQGGSSYPYLADDCDITRIPIGKTQDCINMYVIDRANKVIKITRIGGTKTYDMKKREYMSIPYAN